MPEIKMIVGLGNPGMKYERTRHNVGFFIVDLLAEKWGLSWKNWSDAAQIAGGTCGKPFLLKPQSFMNNSGIAVSKFAAYYRIGIEETLVIVDDFSMPLGKLRLRLTGSAGGHNGLSSIIEHSGTFDFPRFRLGIGPVPAGWDPANFVLSEFDRANNDELESMVDEAVSIVETMLAEGWEKAASLIGVSNGKEKNKRL